jgi:predicted SAM-dependent methyltransferase
MGRYTFKCYRILKQNGKITIRVPYKLYGLRSAYHVRYLENIHLILFVP